jgi:hypothetical protein
MHTTQAPKHLTTTKESRTAA